MSHEKKRGPFQFLQFSVIGMSNAVIDIGTLNLLLILFSTNNKIMLILFNTLSYTLAVANSYFWNARITFRSSAKGSNWQRFTFAIQGIVSLGVSNLIFLLATISLEGLGIPTWLGHNIAKVLAMLLSSLSSFFMIKYMVFKEGRKVREKE